MRNIHCTTSQALDEQIGGNHYTRMKIQPIEFSMVNNLDACQHTIIKYVCRHEYKNGIEDLVKAKHCIDLLIQLKYGEQTTDEDSTMATQKPPRGDGDGKKKKSGRKK